MIGILALLWGINALINAFVLISKSRYDELNLYENFVVYCPIVNTIFTVRLILSKYMREKLKCLLEKLKKQREEVLKKLNENEK